MILATRIARPGLAGLLGTLVLAMVGVTTLQAQPGIDGGGLLDLVILHVNDIHGYSTGREFLGEQLPPEFLGRRVGGLVSAASIVDRWRQRLFAADPEAARTFARTGDDGVLFLDGGDTYSGTLSDFETKGELSVRLTMSPFLDVDAAVVGNHAWDYGPARFKQLAALVSTHHPLLAANLRGPGPDLVAAGTGLVAGGIPPLPARGGRTLTGRPWPLADATIVECRGVRIGIVGLLTPTAVRESLPQNTRGLSLEDPVAALARCLDRFAELPPSRRPQVTIALCHVAFERDEKMLARLGALDDHAAHRNVDVVIDGHSHKDHQIQVDADTLLVQADHYGVKLGEIVLGFDRSTCKVGRVAARRIVLSEPEVPAHRPMVLAHRDLIEKARSIDEAVVVPVERGFSLPALLRSDNTHLASPVGNFVAWSIRERAMGLVKGGVDVSLVNQSGVRGGLYAATSPGFIEGPGSSTAPNWASSHVLTAGVVHAVSPFGNRLYVAQVTASRLLDLLGRRGIQHVPRYSWAGLSVEAVQEGRKPGAAGKRRLVSAGLHGRDGAPDRPLSSLGDTTLTVVAPSYLALHEIGPVAVPGSVRILDMTDREALRASLEVLGRETGVLTGAAVARRVGTPTAFEIHHP